MGEILRKADVRLLAVVLELRFVSEDNRGEKGSEERKGLGHAGVYFGGSPFVAWIWSAG